MPQIKLDYVPFSVLSNARISLKLYEVIDKFGNVVGHLKGDTIVALLKQDCFTVTDDNPVIDPCSPSPCNC